VLALDSVRARVELDRVYLKVVFPVAPLRA
jgi:hypothetical protein